MFGDSQWETFLLKTTFKKHIYMFNILSKDISLGSCVLESSKSREKEEE